MNLNPGTTVLIDGEPYNLETLRSEMDWGIDPYVCSCEWTEQGCDGCRRRRRAAEYHAVLERNRTP